MFSGPASPTTKKSNKAQLIEEEDLYNWMRRQQTQSENTKEKSSSLEKSSPGEATIEQSVHVQIEDDIKEEQVNQSMRQGTSGNSFLDAHIIFEPILSSLGLMPQQITNLSLKGFHILRLPI